jgi:hypothetical protein
MYWIMGFISKSGLLSLSYSFTNFQFSSKSGLGKIDSQEDVFSIDDGRHFSHINKRLLIHLYHEHQIVEVLLAVENDLYIHQNAMTKQGHGICRSSPTTSPIPRLNVLPEPQLPL